MACAECGKKMPDFMLVDGLCAVCQSRLREVEAAREKQARFQRVDPHAPNASDQLTKVAEERARRREAGKKAREDEAAAVASRQREVMDRYSSNNEQTWSQLEDRYAEEIERTEAHKETAMAEAISEARLAQQEMARRRLAKNRLLPYVRMTVPNYEAGWFHKDLCRELENFFAAVERGESPRLMISTPPRHGKSQLASVTFPAWALGKRPDFEIISASYSADLANKMSRGALTTVRSRAHKRVFPDFNLDKNAQSVTEWSTSEGGTYFPTGVGGAATGRGCNILIIDDFCKNREEAESEQSRQGVIDWYTSTAYTRLAPGGGVIIIATRWHDGDLIGWLEAKGAKDEGDKWRFINYPAIATEDETYRRKGDPLHAERFPLTALLKIKKAIGPRDWNALYQQNPVPDSGDYFQKEDFHQVRLADVPARDELSVYAAWDFAIGQKQDNDFTVGVAVGFDIRGNVWILGCYRGQWGSVKIIDKMFALHRRWRPEMTGGEHGHISMTLAPFIATRKVEEQMFDFHVEPLKVGRMDKVARARSFQGLVQSGKVYIPMDAPWAEDVLHELTRFPNGKTDDIVDALAHIGMMQQRFQPAAPEPAPKKESWRDRLDQYSQGSQRSGGAMGA